MKWYWKLFIGLFSVFMLVIVLNIGLNIWIAYQLPKIINSKSDAAYTITYDNLEVSLLHRTIIATKIELVPKVIATEASKKGRIYATIDTIKVDNFKIFGVLFSDRIVAKSITIEQPRVILYKNNKKGTLRESVMTPFEKIISVSDVYLNKGQFKIINGTSKVPILTVQNIYAQLEGIVITQDILDDVIPFQFKNYTLKCDSLNYRPNEFYQIKTKTLLATINDLKMDDFEMIPSYSRREFVAKIDKEKDLNTVFCKSVVASKMNWGFKNHDFFFHCNAIDLNEVNASIYRSKVPADDLSKKLLYNKLLRDLKFDLKVDTLKVHNSIIEYEEEKSFNLGAGKLRFSKFNLLATNIGSGFKKQKLEDVAIKINCIFMNESPLFVGWKFNVMDKSDGFNIKGTMSNFDVEKMAVFTKPYMNITTKGVIDKMRFNFTGNDKGSAGDFAVQYDDLKFTVYQKDDRKKKNKFLTFVAKVFVKNDTKEKINETTIAVERIPEKSFYNLLWRSVAEGLKKILI